MKDTVVKTNAPEDKEIPSPREVAVTPMMQQYMQVKEAHKDCLLFYRMGDFYELFFEDAMVAARVLDIALTKRGKHDTQDIPMCGVPHHSYEPYLHKLIGAGHKVAICEQMESPEEAKKRGYKAVVRREVVRIVTPGTLIEDNLLQAKEPNFLAAIVEAGQQIGLAWIDISTGDFRVMQTSLATLANDMALLQPKELLLSDSLFQNEKYTRVLRESSAFLSPYAASFFNSSKAESRLKSYFGVLALEGFGMFGKAEMAAAGALLDYVALTQKNNYPRLSPPYKIQPQHFMRLDMATRRNLEITQTSSGEYKGSLLGVMDYPLTSGGGRLLRQYLMAPLAHASAINARLDGVSYFVNNPVLQGQIRDVLIRVPDIERALSRLYMGKGSPRDLAAIRDGLHYAGVVASLCKEGAPENKGTAIPDMLAMHMRHLEGYQDIVALLIKALSPDVAGMVRDGGYIAAGFDGELDQLRGLRDNGRERLMALQQKYRDETGIATLKVTYNNVLGYFIEATPQQAKKITQSHFIHRQTLASAMRYTTEELRHLENAVLHAKEQALVREVSLFNQLVQEIMQRAEAIALTAQAIWAMDVAAALAALAKERDYVRPEVEDSMAFDIVRGRHPVVEMHMLEQGGQGFVTNDCNLSGKQRLWLLTGPNMAGKSTFLRQNALIAIMAQIGSYVPAASARIGVVDRLFSRVGASDDLARGHSTFMVEMVETAVILNQATAKSLVILDEIGRGTATFDGLSIAWAVVEHLHNISQCRGLFATHFHELTTLASVLAALTCYTVRVREWQGDVVFLHEVVQGTADRSYGVHVAKLAGLPAVVVARAKEILQVLESSKNKDAAALLTHGLPLFAAPGAAALPVEKPMEKAFSAIEARLGTLSLDDLTPRDAMGVLYELRMLLKEE